MGLTVYLSNTDIEVVSGQTNGKSVSVSHVYQTQMPEGSFLNGVITDPDGLEYALINLWDNFKLPKKGIRLVVNTTQISVRVLDMPIMSHSKADTYLRREFEERGGEKNKLLGFYVIAKDVKKKTMKVCTELADVDFIDNYISSFQRAGISIKEINSGIGVSVNFLKKMKFASETNSVVMLRDGMTVTAIYLVKGEYFYSTTARTFNNPGTLEYAGELSNTINQIVQFSKSEKVEDNISDIFLAGMTPDDSVNVERAVSMNQSEEMKVHNLTELKGVRFRDKEDSIDELFYPTAGLMTLSDHQNLLKMYGKGEVIDNSKKIKKIKLAVPYVLAFLVMTGITVSRVMTYSKEKKELKVLEDYLANPAHKLKLATYDEAAARAQVFSDHVNALRLMETNIDSYPLPTKEVCDIIEKAATGLGSVRIDRYDESSGVIGITAIFSEVDTVNTFIDRLDAEDCFYAVDYTGYSEMNQQGEWMANLQCVLAEKAGR
ncbi:MAG: hypothetical protein IKQ71_04435 [Lachnospiraceae bacterium]|nr:hypothetical protein [Lachnospiraceae bacterium]